MSEKSQASGGSRLRRAGKTAVQIGATAEQIGMLREAARKVGLPVTQFLLTNGLEQARKILGK